MLPFGTQVGAFFYGGSGTPLTTYVYTSTDPAVRGRPRRHGPDAMLTQTDLLVSHDLKFGGAKRLRFELNVLNVFNQKTARHIFNCLNRRAGAPRVRRSTWPARTWRRATTTTRCWPPGRTAPTRRTRATAWKTSSTRGCRRGSAFGSCSRFVRFDGSVGPVGRSAPDPRFLPPVPPRISSPLTPADRSRGRSALSQG